MKGYEKSKKQPPYTHSSGTITPEKDDYEYLELQSFDERRNTEKLLITPARKKREAADRKKMEAADRKKREGDNYSVPFFLIAAAVSTYIITATVAVSAVAIPATFLIKKLMDRSQGVGQMNNFCVYIGGICIIAFFVMLLYILAAVLTPGIYGAYKIIDNKIDKNDTASKTASTAAPITGASSKQSTKSQASKAIVSKPVYKAFSFTDLSPANQRFLEVAQAVWIASCIGAALAGSCMFIVKVLVPRVAEGRYNALPIIFTTVFIILTGLITTIVCCAGYFTIGFSFRCRKQKDPKELSAPASNAKMILPPPYTEVDNNLTVQGQRAPEHGDPSPPYTAVDSNLTMQSHKTPEGDDPSPPYTAVDSLKRQNHGAQSLPALLPKSEYSFTGVMPEGSKIRFTGNLPPGGVVEVKIVRNAKPGEKLREVVEAKEYESPRIPKK